MTDDNLSILRKAFAPQNTSTPSQYYPFWLMEIGKQAKIRFLPNKDGLLTYVVLDEWLEHILTINGDRHRYPCLTQYDEDCSICNIAQGYYRKDEQEKGGQYYKKRKYVGQVLVQEDPVFTGEDNLNGKVRLISFSSQVFKVMSEQLSGEDNDIDVLNYKDGYDFIIKKTKQGQYANYAAGTGFSRKRTKLDAETIKLCEESIIDIRSIRPKNPGEDVIQRALDKALAGEVADTQPVVASSPEAEKKSADVDEGSSDADEVLTAVKARRKAKAE